MRTEAQRAASRRSSAKKRAQYKSLGWCDKRTHHRHSGGLFVKPPAAPAP